MDEVGEGLLPVHEDDGDPIAVALLELRVARDVPLLEVEVDFRSHALENEPGALAEMAAARPVDRDGLTGRAHG